MAREERDVWRPNQYLQFKKERMAPYFDLLRLLRPAPGGTAIDLGCGTAETTRELHEASGVASTLCVDSSANMLEKAVPHLLPGMQTRLQGISEFLDEEAAKPRTFDIVTSNAALHWLEDHNSLLPRLAALVAPPRDSGRSRGGGSGSVDISIVGGGSSGDSVSSGGIGSGISGGTRGGRSDGGQLLIGMPANHRHITQTVAAEVAAAAPHAAALGGFVRQSPVLEPERYAELLCRLGFDKPIVRLQVYVHPLLTGAAAVEWMRGSTLTDYEKRMAPAAFEAFLADYRRALARHVPPDRPYLFTFQRLFLWACRRR